MSDTRICKLCDGGPGNEGVCLCGTRAYEEMDILLAAAPKAEPVSATDDLIDGFAAALKSKLNTAAEKYGYNDDWMRPEWREDLVRHLIAHVEKGDPRDVAAYCAFAWHHGWSVKPEGPKARRWSRSQNATDAMASAASTSGLCATQPPPQPVMNWWRL